jgi:hypothetical protein
LDRGEKDEFRVIRHHDYPFNGRPNADLQKIQLWIVRSGQHRERRRREETADANRDLQKVSDQKKHTSRTAFTACTAGISLLETMEDAAEIAARVATIMLSTARSSFDEFQNARKCGEKLYILVKSISWGGSRMNPNRCGEMTAR